MRRKQNSRPGPGAHAGVSGDTFTRRKTCIHSTAAEPPPALGLAPGQPTGRADPHLPRPRWPSRRDTGDHTGGETKLLRTAAVPTETAQPVWFGKGSLHPVTGWPPVPHGTMPFNPCQHPRGRAPVGAFTEGPTKASGCWRLPAPLLGPPAPSWLRQAPVQPGLARACCRVRPSLDPQRLPGPAPQPVGSIWGRGSPAGGLQAGRSRVSQKPANGLVSGDHRPA